MVAWIEVRHLRLSQKQLKKFHIINFFSMSYVEIYNQTLQINVQILCNQLVSEGQKLHIRQIKRKSAKPH